MTQVNNDGILTFTSEAPTFSSVSFPLTFPVKLFPALVWAMTGNLTHFWLQITSWKSGHRSSLCRHRPVTRRENSLSVSVSQRMSMHHITDLNVSQTIHVSRGWRRETNDTLLLERVDKEIGNNFPAYSAYSSKSLFIATFANVSSYKQELTSPANVGEKSPI